jgi:pimeloyl-ACP methyl ester carboxylesterase
VGHHADRIASLVLTSCDVFEKFPPAPQRYLEVAVRSRALMWFVGWTAQFKLVQRLPTAYGWTTGKPIDPAIMRSYTAPVRTNPGVRNDLRRLLLAVDTRYTYEAAESLRSFDKPALVLWGDGDKLFPREHGRRLAELLPQGKFELIAGSRTFVPEEQPERLASIVQQFLA